MFLIFGEHYFYIMASVDTGYSFVKYLIRKNQTGGVTPLEYALAYNRAQRNYYDFLMGQVNGFQYGKPIPKIGLGMSTKIARLLSPFKVMNTPIPVTGGVAPYGGGIATYPASYPDISLAAMFDTSYRKVERIDDTKISSRIGSKIDPLTDNSSPFYVEGATGWLVYPNSVTTILATYYRLPVNVVWGYTLNGNGREIYDPTASTQPEWDDVSDDEILGRAIRIMGYSFSAEDKIKFGEEVLQRGE